MQTALPASVDIMARTLWGEGRGTGAPGMSHIASVIINRANHPRWWGNGVIGVCQAPWQFSCWNKSDPNHDKIIAVTEADGWFAIAVAIANKAIAGMLPDATGGADSYYALSMATPPAWSRRGKETFRDAWHAFYRIELPLPGTDAPVAHNASINSQTVAFAPSVAAPAEQSADDLNAAELDKLKG